MWAFLVSAGRPGKLAVIMLVHYIAHNRDEFPVVVHGWGFSRKPKWVPASWGRQNFKFGPFFVYIGIRVAALCFRYWVPRERKSGGKVACKTVRERSTPGRSPILECSCARTAR
jgi:hypothetical protein